MNYGEQMNLVRTDNDVLQKEIAKILDISVYTYSHYETEDALIPINHLITFCDYFKVSVDYILGLSDEKSYNFLDSSINSSLRLKDFRKDNNLTQAELAKSLNTNQSVIANYERGRNIIATPFLYETCKKYNISADYLLGRIDSPKYLK